mmetsp:Transcript_60866/g.83591  ORF Transcript_60866/g.83591 Transcript_60866/m.83591 type:complete len:108 (+) Transcript_60866:71-394(+)
MHDWRLALLPGFLTAPASGMASSSGQKMPMPFIFPTDFSCSQKMGDCSACKAGGSSGILWKNLQWWLTSNNFMWNPGLRGQPNPCLNSSPMTVVQSLTFANHSNMWP